MPVEPSETVSVDRREWVKTQQRLATLEAALARLEAGGNPATAVDARASRAATEAKPDGPRRGLAGPSEDPARIDRRQAFGKLAGVAAAGVLAGTVAAGAEPAAAANGQAIVLGNNSNAASAATGTAVSGSGLAYGFGVTDNGYSGSGLQGPAIFGHAAGGAFSHAGQMLAEGSAVGLTASAVDGYGMFSYSSTSYALVANSSSGSGVAISTGGSTSTGLDVRSSGIGTRIETFGNAQARLQTVAGLPAPAPPDTTQAHVAGDQQVDTNGPVELFQRSPSSNLWFCVGDGQPGAWRKLAGPGTAGAFHALPAPVRVYDSRPGTAPSTGPKTPLVANTPRTFDVTLNSSGVPVGATAVVVNLLLVNAKPGNGNFTIWANGVARPQANNMVWGGSAGRFSSPATTVVDAAARCQVQSSLQTDFVLDVVGYYR